jgi:hypothetical protein
MRVGLNFLNAASNHNIYSNNKAEKEMLQTSKPI